MSSQRDPVPLYETALKAAALPPISSASRIDLEADDRSRLVFLADPTGLAVERYKLLRRRLCALNSQGGVILLTSPAPADGKTLTAINLAFSFAEAGQSTCLVDLDFRSPGIFPVLEYASDAPDVVDVLEGRANLSQAIHQIGSRPLHVAGIRHEVRTPSFQLGSAAFGSFVLRLRAAFTWVILDLAPAIPFSDVSEILPDVDGALMVVRAGKTKKTTMGPSLEILGSKLWGVVLNDAVVSGEDHYGYYNYGRTSKRSPQKAKGEYEAIRGISLKS